MIGVIPQALTSDLDLTVEENMNIYAKLYDVPSKERKKSIDELLELVDLTKWRDAATKTVLTRHDSPSNIRSAHDSALEARRVAMHEESL